MPKEINVISVPVVGEQDLRAVLDEFEAKSRFHVNLRIVGWEQYRSEMVDIALHQQGVDVSLVGTPVTSDLIGMNLLRPFSLGEISRLGGAASFLASRWHAGMRPGDPQVWGLPFLVDLRVFFYWRDMLQQAGVDEQTAFSSHSSIEAAMQSLAEHGFQPWDVAQDRFQILHCVSSWIWEAGGDLFTPDGRQVIVHQPESLAAMRAFFSLLRFAPAVRGASHETAFRQRQIALCVASGTSFSDLEGQNMGSVPLPGGSYIGGTDLVIWNSTRNEFGSLELARFLVQPDIQERLASTTTLLSSRMSVLTRPENLNHPVRSAAMRAALTGRTFPCVPMIGLLEDRLSTTLSMIQHEVLANPEVNVEALLNDHIVPLARRMNTGLSSATSR